MFVTFRGIGVNAGISNRSPNSQNCHQHQSPTSGSSISHQRQRNHHWSIKDISDKKISSLQIKTEKIISIFFVGVFFEFLKLKRMILALLVINGVFGSRIFGNRYSGQSGVAEIVLVPPQGVFWTPKSCLYIPHT